MRTFYLEPIDGRKSFGHKCHVNEYVVDGEKMYDLISYGKRVAYCNETQMFICINSVDSVTTKRHINSFLYFFDIVDVKYNAGDYILFNTKHNQNRHGWT